MAKAKGKSLADFRATHDPRVIVPGKIRAGLAELAKEGPEAWEYDQDFRRRVGLNPTQMEEFRGEFENHTVQVQRGKRQGGKRIVWVGDAKAAEKFRAVKGI